MPVPLLMTKLHIPPLRSALVPRPRLIERLDAGLRAAYGQVTEAIDHALPAEDFERAASLLSQQAEALWTRGWLHLPPGSKYAVPARALTDSARHGRTVWSLSDSALG